MTRNDLLEFFLFCLSRPPCRPGRRLVSELELARLTGEGRQKLRGILNELERQGYLSRKKGSGTFVRKLVPYEPQHTEEEIFSNIRLLPEAIFQNREHDGAGPDLQAQQLRIGISGGFALKTSVNYRIFESACRRLEELGCRTVTAVSGEDNSFQLPDTLCDGYLCLIRHAPLLRAALAAISPEAARIPASFFHPGSYPVEDEPLVTLDTYEALQRGVHILAERGFRRIAFAGCVIRPCRRTPLQFFLEALTEERLFQYRDMVIADLDNPQRETIALRNLRELFDREVPDAILVQDDHLLPVVQEVCSERDLIPGRDIGILALTNRSEETPPGAIRWSALEFDPSWVGERAAENLVAAIRSPGTPPLSFSQQAAWVEGTTLGVPPSSEATFNQ